MSKIVLHPTETAHWHSLICEAEQATQQHLDEELESYVVFLLMRFLSKPQIADSIIALEYIEAMRTSGTQQFDNLRNVGDICLLHAGLFPERAQKRRVSNNYYVEMGSGAYQTLSDGLYHELSTLYGRLSQTFIDITAILQSMRELGHERIPSLYRLIDARSDQPLEIQAFSEFNPHTTRQ
jgi:hypothetical protein